MKITNDMSLKAVLELSIAHPDNAEIQLECAFYCDNNIYEEKAIPLYQNAITLGLPDEKLQIAYNNLGSSYLAVGNHEEALKVLNDGIARFPNFRPPLLFKALTLFDIGKYGEAFDICMRQLLETTSDEDIFYYKRALGYYASELREKD